MRSRQTPFVLGLVVLGGATLSFALGSSLPVLLIARVMQGMSTAIVFTVGFALLFDVIGKEKIGQAMGYTSMSLSLGLFLGPVVGGIIYQYEGYFQVFIPAFVLIALEILLRFVVVEQRTPSKPSSTESSKPGSRDASRTRLLHADTNGSLYGAINTQVPSDERVVASGRSSVTPTNASLHSHRSGKALWLASTAKVGRSSIVVLLSSPRLLVAMVGLFVINSFTTAFEGVLPVYVHQLFGFNSMHAALMFLAITLPMLFSPLVGSLTDRIGAKWPATVGFVLAVPCLILLRLVNYDERSAVITLVGLLFWFGCAVSLAMPPMMTEVTYVVEEQEERCPGIFGPYGAYSQAYGLTNAAFAGGALVGPLYAGFIRESLGWPTMSLVMGVLSAVMAVFALVMTGGYLFRTEGGDSLAGKAAEIEEPDEEDRVH